MSEEESAPPNGRYWTADEILLQLAEDGDTKKAVRLIGDSLMSFDFGNRLRIVPNWFGAPEYEQRKRLRSLLKKLVLPSSPEKIGEPPLNAVPPFIQRMLDSDSIFTTGENWQIKKHVIESDIFSAVREARVSNPGKYIFEHFRKSDGSCFSLADVRDRIKKAK
ncbi:MAG: hypothetical protein ABSF43_13310 [Rectinemataceae bacterium]|jgi:hypothetical protein